MNLDLLIDNFATRSFRDTGDGDYIAARLAYRSQLIPQFLWSSLQAIEKYLKCVLVLNRICAPKGHNLAEILEVFEKNKKFELRLTEATRKFLSYLDTYGQYRYYETPYFTKGFELISLDRAVWEVRRYARVMNYNLKNAEGNDNNMLQHEITANESAEILPPHRFVIIGGRLESIMAKRDHPSREPLLWQNAFFGHRARKSVTLPSQMEAGNSPLTLHPEILDEILKYVWLPKRVSDNYRYAASTAALNE